MKLFTAFLRNGNFTAINKIILFIFCIGSLIEVTHDGCDHSWAQTMFFF